MGPSVTSAKDKHCNELVEGLPSDIVTLSVSPLRFHWQNPRSILLCLPFFCCQLKLGKEGVSSPLCSGMASAEAALSFQ